MVQLHVRYWQLTGTNQDMAGTGWLGVVGTGLGGVWWMWGNWFYVELGEYLGDHVRSRVTGNESCIPIFFI